MIKRLAACLLLTTVGFAAELPTIEQAIGWRLFFDENLSGPRNTSCATCHDPSRGYEQGVALGKGAHGETLARNTPTVVNLAETQALFWDGRAGSLEEQAQGPITNPLEMDLALDEAAARVRADDKYVRAFAKLGIREITIDHVTKAIAAFERGLVTGETAYDRWLGGDREALTEEQNRGRQLFFTRGQCALCHIGNNFSDGDFHNIGTGSQADMGRASVSGDDGDAGKFKVPSLRNWKGREPFMHDGRFATLREVLNYYNDPGDGAVGVSEIDPLAFSVEDLAALELFMEALNGSWPDLEPFEQRWRALAAP